ncbi:hypothetical protein VNO80_21303 [Phaseolus coccineus]|uniref:Uncharacterized protein n=1 Tax=Phaseolus coccineus TaxID=3886 RepID=A0AAN9M285_PHACN
MIWRTVTLFLCSDLNKGLNAFDYLSCELIEQTQVNASRAISSSTSIIFLHAPHKLLFPKLSFGANQRQLEYGEIDVNESVKFPVRGD